MFATPITYSWPDYPFEDYSSSWKRYVPKSIHNSIEAIRALPIASSKEFGPI